MRQETVNLDSIVEDDDGEEEDKEDDEGPTLDANPANRTTGHPSPVPC